MADLSENMYLAKNLIAVHGQRAMAVARERLEEARMRGDSSGMVRWQNAEAAIAELRQSDPMRQMPARH
ncbi:hypothetical protein [Rhodopila sp.]|jgi:hypothetical protein|uniref:hypothetical protein n=1 Tax=Rhodopila sp. TaxID=2480087 RepID=UPI002C9AC541|nr:hypothetical protein [Rhodopila sp.]HVZ07509.1 hypothetical protein [Rhodopila sp.]